MGTVLELFKSFHLDPPSPSIGRQAIGLQLKDLLVLTCVSSTVLHFFEIKIKTWKIKRYMFYAPNETFIYSDAIRKISESVLHALSPNVMTSAVVFPSFLPSTHCVLVFFWELWVILNCFGLGKLYYKRHCVWGDPLEKERKYLH